MPDDADAGFFKNVAGLATAYVRTKRRKLQRGDPETNVDSMGGGHRYQFGGQEITFEDLRDIKDIRESGGQVAALMEHKALLNFGEGAEVHVETDGDPETEVIDGEELTLEEWLETEAFPHLDLTVLDLGTDALWYPAAYGEIRETRAGDFKDALPAEPWTVLPMCDDAGEIVGYKQRTKSQSGGYVEQSLDPDQLWSIILNKRSARDKTGISEVLRNREEIQAFKENERAINQAIELHGFPQRHIKVGKEDGAPVRDDDLRRVRTIFDPRTTDANTAYFTGQDVDVESLEAEQFDFGAVHEMDMRNLTTALGLPLEAGNVGSDGLGSGKPAELRFALLKLAIKGNQRSFGVQFVENVIRPVVRDYSPFDHTATITLEIDDPLEDIGEVADLINQIGGYMTNDEIRRKLDLPEPDDDEIGEAYRSPADIEKSDAGDPVDEGPFGGMFEQADVQAGDGEDFRCLAGGVTDRDLQNAPEWDRPLLEMYQGVTDPESDPNRALVDFAASGTPEFVLDRIRDAIDAGAMFSQFDEIPSSRLMDLRQEFKGALGTDDFTLDSITDSIMDFEADLSRDDAERIARTESTAVLNKSRELSYEEKGEGDERFYWTGAEPGDPRQTEFCEYLIEKSNPFHGGEPMPKDELKAEIQRAPEIDDDINTSPREWTPHINCRSTFVLEPSEGI